MLPLILLCLLGSATPAAILLYVLSARYRRERRPLAPLLRIYFAGCGSVIPAVLLELLVVLPDVPGGWHYLGAADAPPPSPPCPPCAPSCSLSVGAP